jgi:lipoprotein-releasing system permease protein
MSSSRLPFLIGLRYMRAKKKNHFISFISMVSVLGIALSVTVLITVLSVVNGFEQEIKTRLLILMPQVTVTNWKEEVHSFEKWSAMLEKAPHVEGVAPYIHVQAMLGSLDQPAFAFIKGIDPVLESRVSPIEEKMVAGHLANLKAGGFGIIIGKGLAAQLGVGLGDNVTVFVPKATASVMGVVPRVKAFKVVGMFHTGFEHDYRYALMHIQDAAVLMRMGDAVSGLEIAIDEPFNSDQIVRNLLSYLPDSLLITDWKRQNQNLFSALQMMKSSLFFVLILIVGVAAFNMLSSLVMLVTDKQSDIAILRTMGASARSILSIFVVQGLAVGLIGALMGLVGGVSLSKNLPEVVSWLENMLQVRFIPEGVYLINFLPSQLLWSDVVVVFAVTLFLSFLATLYPAYRASRVQPVEALRYE